MPASPSFPTQDIPSLQGLLDFTGQTAVVTGGGRGLGAAIARRFAEAGANVVVGYRSSRVEAEQVVSDIEGAGGRALAVQADVTVKAEIDVLLSQAENHFSGLDVLINNAGIYPMAALIEMTGSEWDATLNADLKSVFLATQAAARRMIARGQDGQGGAIINIASIEASNPAPLHSHYNAAKAAVVMHTRAAAQELGPQGIRVNSVSPGLIWRPGLDQDWPEGVERYERSAPLGRLGRPEDVADACLFLASTAARWITGVDLRVDGGVMTSQAY